MSTANQRNCSYLNVETKITREKPFYGARNTLRISKTSQRDYRCQKIEFKMVVALHFTNWNTILTYLQRIKEIVVS